MDKTQKISSMEIVSMVKDGMNARDIGISLLKMVNYSGDWFSNGLDWALGLKIIEIIKYYASQKKKVNMPIYRVIEICLNE